MTVRATDTSKSALPLSLKEIFLYFFLGVGLTCVLAVLEGGPFSLSSRKVQVAQSYLTSTTSTNSTSTGRRAQFIFTMAIFSDGKLHDALGKSIEQSSSMKALEAIGVIPKIVELHELLYQSIADGNSSPGLWNAHCEVGTTKANAGALHQGVVRVLKEISLLVETANTLPGSGSVNGRETYPSPILAIPINTVLWTNNTTMTEKRYGHVTYPTEHFSQSCHRNDFPSLDLLYMACQEAEVDCRHVHVHRPPLWELKQILTTRIDAHTQLKGPNAAPFQDHLAVIHLWNTMLHIIADELMRFAPRNLGCVDATNYQTLWTTLWGSSSDGNASAAMVAELPSTLFPTEDLTRDDLESVLPASAAPYLESYLQLSAAANQACVDSLQQLHDFIKNRQATVS